MEAMQYEIMVRRAFGAGYLDIPIAHASYYSDFEKLHAVDFDSLETRLARGKVVSGMSEAISKFLTNHSVRVNPELQKELSGYLRQLHRSDKPALDSIIVRCLEICDQIGLPA
jgi:hypothetical protein